MKWFKEIDTLDGLRKLYRRLVVKYHPDNSGSEEIIKEINAEYDVLFKRLKEGYEKSEAYQNATERQKQAYDSAKDQKLRDMIIKLSRYHGLTIELCAVWLWVSGNTKEHKDELHRLGLHYARNKKCWYIHFDDFVKYGKHPASMDYIRDKYGSTVIHAEKKEDMIQA